MVDKRRTGILIKTELARRLIFATLKTVQRVRKTGPLRIGLLPDERVTPQQVFLDLRAGEDFGAEFADLAHGWVKVVVFVCGPGVASFA